jgi:uncharacterized membrane protein
MMFGWGTASNSDCPLAAAAVTSGMWYYLGLALVVVILLITLIAFYRTWEEMNDVEEPDSPADLLESFEKAHADGEIDDRELDRVRRLLAAGGASGMAIPSGHRPEDSSRPTLEPSSPAEDADSARVGGVGPPGP